jgi:predicted anti-sigma-YlaC factor YlaD
MNCFELQASLVEIEDGRSAQQRDHLKTCPECSALVTELILIASTAVELRAVDEPGRVLPPPPDLSTACATSRRLAR